MGIFKKKYRPKGRLFSLSWKRGELQKKPCISNWRKAPKMELKNLPKIWELSQIFRKNSKKISKNLRKREKNFPNLAQRFRKNLKKEEFPHLAQTFQPSDWKVPRDWNFSRKKKNKI